MVRRKTAAEIHRDLLASGVFERETQVAIANIIKADQSTVSRIAAGRFKRLNKAVGRLCNYAKLATTTEQPFRQDFLKVLKTADLPQGSEAKKLMGIIDLAVELLRSVKS